MFYDTTQVTSLTFFGTHEKPHGVRGLSKNSHMQIYPKLGHGTCVIHQISCARSTCAFMLDQTWDPGVALPNQFH